MLKKFKENLALWISILAIVVICSAVAGHFYGRYNELARFLLTFATLDSTPEHVFLPTEYESQLFTLVNDERVSQGLKPLVKNTKLEESAKLKANDILLKGYWAHISPDGQTPWDWFNKVGFKYQFAGENLAKDFTNPKSTVIAWMNSPEHRKDILTPEYVDTGISVVEGRFNGMDTKVVVQHFGKELLEATPRPVNTTSSRTGEIVKYHEWCTQKDINVYSNEIVVKKSSDGNTYGMTVGDWTCYENFLLKK